MSYSVAANNKLFACRHLPKCFDNVHNLEFRKDEAGDPTKGAIGMYSGDNDWDALTAMFVSF